MLSIRALQVQQEIRVFKDYQDFQARLVPLAHQVLQARLERVELVSVSPLLEAIMLTMLLVALQD